MGRLSGDYKPQASRAEQVVNIYIYARDASNGGTGFQFIGSGKSLSQVIIHYAHIEKMNRGSKED